MPEEIVEQAETAMPEQPAETVTESTDWKAEAEKWKSLSRKNEEKAKANNAQLKELEEFKKAQMSEQDKALEAAKAEARKGAITEMGAKLVAAEVRVAAAGRLDAEKLSVLLDGLNLGKFLTDAGDPDTEAITSWVDSIVPKSDPTFPDLGQGKTGQTEDPMIAAFKRGAGLI